VKKRYLLLAFIPSLLFGQTKWIRNYGSLPYAWTSQTYEEAVPSDAFTLVDSASIKFRLADNGAWEVIILDEDGNTHAIVDSIGNVGIGTDSPNNLLHLEKDQNAATVLEIQNNDSGSSAYAGIVLDSDGGNNSIIYQPSSGYSDSNTQDKLVLQDSDGIFINTPFPEFYSSSAARPLIYFTNNNDDNNSALFYFRKLSDSPADGDYLGQWRFYGNDSGLNEDDFVQIGFKASDVTNGDEAGQETHYIAHNGTARNYFEMNGYNGSVNQGYIVFNEDSYDVDFRVESDNDANALFVRGSDGNVGIGTNAPDKILEINGASGGNIRLTYNDGDGSATNYADIQVGSDGEVSLTTVDSDGADGDFTLSLDGDFNVNSPVTSDEEFTWNVGAYDFVTGGTYIAAEAAVHPTNANDPIYAPLNIPFNQFSGTVVIDQITVYYNTDGNGDDFDLALVRTDQDGTITTDEDEDDIGNGTSGAQNSTCLAADLTLTDFAYYIEIDVNNTDTNTDVKIYQIKFEAHLE